MGILTNRGMKMNELLYKKDTLIKRQRETLNETIELVKDHNCCAIVRPTGFGKTYMIAKLIGEVLEKSQNNTEDNRILYVYPTKIIRKSLYEYVYSDDLLDETKNVKLINSKCISRLDTITYYSFGKKLKNEYDSVMSTLLRNYSLIIFDEMHCMGANYVCKGLHSLLPILHKNKVPYIGASATPIRTKGMDVVKEFFCGVCTSIYTLEDMVSDGIIDKKPYYVYSLYAYNKYYKNHSRFKVMSASEVDKIANKIETLYNCSEVIKRNVDRASKESGLDKNYMKFICFFLEKEHIKKRAHKVIQYFKDAFPDKRIRTLIITSDKMYYNNIEKLEGLKYKDNTIDLIFTINMLNMGYHVGDITGVLMFRSTQSSIVYSQQVGRAISAKSKNCTIIFDFVGNFNINPIIKDCILVADTEEDNNNIEFSAEGQETKQNKKESNQKLGLNSVILIDEVKSFKEYIRKIDTASESELIKALKWYTEADSSGVPGSKYGMSLEEIQKGLGTSPMIHQFIRYLKSRGYGLMEWDLQNAEWRRIYEQA